MKNKIMKTVDPERETTAIKAKVSSPRMEPLARASMTDVIRTAKTIIMPIHTDIVII